MSNVLSPNKRPFSKMSDIKAMNQQRERELMSPDAEDDHPALREIRKRTAEGVEEFAELGII